MTTDHRRHSMTTEAARTVDILSERLRPLFGSRELFPLAKRTDWAIEQGIITIDDVPQVEQTVDSVETFAEWLKSSGVEAAYETRGRRLLDTCPAWCEGGHEARIGPEEEIGHASAPLVESAFTHLYIDQQDTYEGGLEGDPEVWVSNDLKVTNPDDLERIADDLKAAAIRWRELTA